MGRDSSPASVVSDGSHDSPPKDSTAAFMTGDNSKKRSSPSEEAGQAQKVAKRRAARACASCRARCVFPSENPNQLGDKYAHDGAERSAATSWKARRAGTADGITSR